MATLLPAGAMLLLPAVSGPVGVRGQGNTALSGATPSTIPSRGPAPRDAPPRGREHVRDMRCRRLGAGWGVGDAPRGRCHRRFSFVPNSGLNSGVDVVDGRCNRGGGGTSRGTSLHQTLNQIDASQFLQNQGVSAL